MHSIGSAAFRVCYRRHWIIMVVSVRPTKIAAYVRTVLRSCLIRRGPASPDRARNFWSVAGREDVRLVQLIILLPEVLHLGRGHRADGGRMAFPASASASVDYSGELRLPLSSLSREGACVLRQSGRQYTTPQKSPCGAGPAGNLRRHAQMADRKSALLIEARDSAIA